MDRATQHLVAQRVIDQHAARTTTLADEAHLIPVASYVSDEHHRREQRTLFRDLPVLACLSVDIPEPGDSITIESGGVPIVVVRADDGGVRAHLNVCRHRGTRVTSGRTSGSTSFSCPFHGWVYDATDGRLLAQPRSCKGFEGVDSSMLGLRSLAAAEAHGLIIVRPGGDELIDADAWLAGLAPDLAARDYATLSPYAHATSTWQCNWKLLIDTFLESYHVPTLHRISLGAAYLGIASPFDAYGPHNRIVVPQTAILDQGDRPRDQWELLPHSVLQYFLAPNVIVSNITGYVMVWRFLAEAVDRTTVEHAMYTVDPVTTDADRERFDQRFAAAGNVTSVEDFPESEVIHRNLASGMTEATIAGRNEPGIIHFHRMIATALAAPG